MNCSKCGAPVTNEHYDESELLKCKQLLGRSLQQTRDALVERDLAIDTANFALDELKKLKEPECNCDQCQCYGEHDTPMNDDQDI